MHSRFVALGCAMVVASSACADVRLLVASNEPFRLFEVDPATAASTLVGSMGGPLVMASLASDDVTGTLYGTATFMQSDLYRVNAETGLATLVGPLGASLMHGLAFRQQDHTLYGINGTNLYRIDTSTGAATPVGPTFGGPLGGLDVDPAGRLIACLAGSDPDAGGLYSVDTVTGTASLITATRRLSSIAFHPETGELFGVENGVRFGDPSRLYKINPTTGDSTLIGIMPGINNALGMEFIVPAPGTMSLGVVTTAGLLRRRRG